VNANQREDEIGEVLDEALETLRWCRQHAEERGAALALRELTTRLGYLAQALSWDMDGDADNATTALGIAQGRTRKQQLSLQDAWQHVWWDH
jgi:hypothetical protein